MPNLTIEISDQQRKKYEAVAFSKGMNLEQYALDSMDANSGLALEMSEAEALEKLKKHLAPALEQTHQGQITPLDMEAFIDRALKNTA